ncbi:luciferin 4-monooxygenase-like isoform X2 [Tenebrio molitor]|uniref:luciferin 4-monooxygenase-like isoform X2 n=1 Tax=Tenebrio molitor TaxID=7067 RepID=UPI0036249165
MTSRSFRFLLVNYLRRSLSTHNKIDPIICGPEPVHTILNIPLGQMILQRLTAETRKESALIDPTTKKTVSYQKILCQSISLARSLRNCGYNKDTNVTICSENSVNFFVPILACLYLGAPVSTISPYYTNKQKLHCFNMTKPEVVFTSRMALAHLRQLKEELHYVEKLILIDGCEADSMENFIKENHLNEGVDFSLAEIDPCEDVAFIVFSPGTTCGLPRGVMLTHTNVVVAFSNLMDSRFYAQAANSPVLGLVPFTHSYGLTCTLFDIMIGKQVVVFPLYEQNNFLSALDKYKIKQVWMLPCVTKMMLCNPIVKKYSLDNLREIDCSGNSLNQIVEKEMRKKFPKLNMIRQDYCLTETTAGILAMDYNKPKAGSCGKVVPQMCCKVVDTASGKLLGPNQIGELYVKGDMVMKGYYGSEPPPAHVFSSDGWFVTGDLVYYDEEQYFHFVERIQDVICYCDRRL